MWCTHQWRMMMLKYLGILSSCFWKVKEESKTFLLYSWCTKSDTIFYGFLGLSSSHLFPISQAPHFIFSLSLLFIPPRQIIQQPLFFFFPSAIKPQLFYFILIFPFASFCPDFPPAGCFSQVIFSWITGSKQQVVSMFAMPCYRDLPQFVEAITLNVSCVTPGALTWNDYIAGLYLAGLS